jgi:quercetin dioxygenase-like cupin family protein
MEILSGARTGLPCERRMENFTGTVWADTFFAQPGEFLHGCVYFTPGARTFWHRHARGQILNIIAGSGIICSAGEPVQQIFSGDVIWIPAGERHWHGATPDSLMVHVVSSFGKTEWFEAVDAPDYARNSIFP